MPVARRRPARRAASTFTSIGGAVEAVDDAAALADVAAGRLRALQLRPSRTESTFAWADAAATAVRQEGGDEGASFHRPSTKSPLRNWRLATVTSNGDNALMPGMPERGAKPNVPRVRKTLLKAVSALSSPLLPDDYLELINPLWSTRELRGRIERIEHETDDAATVLIRPGYQWDGPRARPVPAHRHRHRGRPPLARVLADVRARARGRLDLDHGQERRRGRRLAVPRAPRAARAASSRSAASRATSCCPTSCPDKLLFISAGSGITPIMSMLRSLDRGEMGDVVVLHSARAHRRRDLRRRAARARREARRASSCTSS